MTWARWITTGLAVLLVAGGCGGGGDSAVTSTASSSVSSAATAATGSSSSGGTHASESVSHSTGAVGALETIDACALLTAADAAIALGGPAQVAQGRPEEQPLLVGPGHCTYQPQGTTDVNGAPTVFIGFIRVPNARAEFEKGLQSPDVQEVSNVGRPAVSTIDEDGDAVLSVLVGDEHMMLIEVANMPDPDVELASATALARTVLSRL